MKIVTEQILVREGNFPLSETYQTIISEIKSAIYTVTWAHREKFIINPSKKGNGVKPIKDNFIVDLIRKGWLPEQRMSLAKGMNPGRIDIIKKTSKGIFAVEWETGNISSSHRALNKIAVGIIQKEIIGGLLILPVKGFAKYLTDRIGNYEELAPYFPMYKNLRIENGVIEVFAVEHDEESQDVILIPKGNDGNAEK